MQVAERFSNYSLMNNLKPTQLMTLLSLPAGEETEKFIAEKLREGQEIGKLVLLAEARLGELFNQMPKQTSWLFQFGLQDICPEVHVRIDCHNNNNPNGNNQFRTNSLHEEIDLDEPELEKPKPKLEVAAQMGFNKNQVAQFQTR